MRLKITLYFLVSMAIFGSANVFGQAVEQSVQNGTLDMWETTLDGYEKPVDWDVIGTALQNLYENGSIEVTIPGIPIPLIIQIKSVLNLKDTKSLVKEETIDTYTIGGSAMRLTTQLAATVNETYVGAIGTDSINLPGMAFNSNLNLDANALAALIADGGSIDVGTILDAAELETPFDPKSKIDQVSAWIKDGTPGGAAAGDAAHPESHFYQMLVLLLDANGNPIYSRPFMKKIDPATVSDWTKITIPIETQYDGNNNPIPGMMVDLKNDPTPKMLFIAFASGDFTNMPVGNSMLVDDVVYRPWADPDGGLGIDMVSDAPDHLYSPGDVITYTINVKNNDDFNHTDVSVTAPLPVGVTYVPNSTHVTLSDNLLQEHQTITYTNGAGTFSVPSGVDELTIGAWGGGGHGGNRNDDTFWVGGQSAAGGGGGAYSGITVSVNENDVFNYSVGAGSNNESPGGDSYASQGGNTIVLAKGGSSAQDNTNQPANGGMAFDGIGSIKYGGGRGAAGDGNGGGGGGSSASPLGVGQVGSGQNGGTALSGGGNGGNGSHNSGDGSAGFVPGGGGGGARKAGGFGGIGDRETGGKGADGQITFDYDVDLVIQGTEGAPADIATGWILKPGALMTITYQVKVNNEPDDPEHVINTASANSTESVEIRSASVHDSSAKLLPVTLADFNAVKNGSKVDLSWSTATEQNNAGFDIERSSNQQSWTAIGHVNSNAVGGNSNVQNTYGFTDANPAEGANYYRLRQIDLDGRYHLSETKYVAFNSPARLMIYPNPVVGTATVRGLSGSEYIRVFDATGRAVRNLKATSRQQLIDFNGLSQGVYHVQVLSADGNLLRTLTVIKGR